MGDEKFPFYSGKNPILANDPEMMERIKLARYWDKVPELGSPEYIAIGGGKSPHYNILNFEHLLKKK